MVFVGQARLQVKQKVEDDKRRQYKGTVCQNNVHFFWCVLKQVICGVCVKQVICMCALCRHIRCNKKDDKV